MTLLKRFLFRLKTLFNGGSKESDLDEELQYHLEMAAAEYAAMSPALVARESIAQSSLRRADTAHLWDAKTAAQTISIGSKTGIR